MRTTISLDADVRGLLAEAARRSGRSLKATVNDAIRRGLQQSPERPPAPDWPVFHMGAPLLDLTKTVALEAAEFGITVNAICPAYVRTAIVDKQIADQARTLNIAEAEVIEKVMLGPAAIKRLIEPGEVAEFAVYLASDKASFITGAAHMLDLGWTAR